MTSDLEELLGRLEEVLNRIDELDEPVRGEVFELLDGIDILHRSALQHLGEALDPGTIEQLRAAHPAIGWLFEAYAVGVDEAAAAEAALEQIRPFIHSHGGVVEVLDARGGVVALRMGGACAGCTSSAETLRHGIEEALREHLPGFVAVEVESDDAPAHPPPGPTLVQITPRPGSAAS
jgi:Fe-S cluster biogenesis protein NfuA